MYTPSPSDFPLGSVVCNRHTLVEGVVVGVYDEDTLEVEVDGDVIPMDIEDLLLPDEETETDPDSLQMNDFEVPVGMNLLFVPLGDSDYQVCIANGTSHIYLVSLQKGRGLPATEELAPGKLARSVKYHTDELHELTSLQFTCWRKSDEGTDSHFKKSVKLKASAFVKKAAEMKSTGGDFIIYPFFEDLPPRKGKIKVEFRPDRESESTPFYIDGQSLFKERLGFSEDVDLHAEKLVKDPSKMEASAILRVQMQKANDYLERAIRVGMPRVYLIHGKGKGRLREALHSWLQTHPDVADYHFGYFPKYGHGATEVNLLD